MFLYVPNLYISLPPTYNANPASAVSCTIYEPTPIQCAHLLQGPSFAIQALMSHITVQLNVCNQLFFVSIVPPLLPNKPSEQHLHLCPIEVLLAHTPPLTAPCCCCRTC